MNIIDNLDKEAENYFSEKGQMEERFITKSTLQLILPYSINRKVLQLGLGNGFIAKQLDNVVVSQVVIEGAKSLVDGFNHKLENTKVLHGYFENFTLSENSKFDIILANHVLEHVNDPVQVLKYLKSFLSKEGKILITVPNSNSLHRRIGVALGMLKKVNELNPTDLRVGHQRVYNLDLLHQDIEKGGYSIVEERGYLFKMVSLKQMNNWDEKLLDAIYHVSKDIPIDVCSNLFVVISA